MKLYAKTAHELHDMLVAKEISAAELTESVLAQQAATEEKVGAYITTLADEAMAQAKAVLFFILVAGISVAQLKYSKSKEVQQ